MAKHTIGIDLGGTNTKMGVFTSELKLLEEISIPTNVPAGADAAAKRWLQTLQPWLRKYPVELVGIGSPGPLDCEKGTIIEGPNLQGWLDYSFTDFFRKELGVKSYIENDANCAALGEWAHNPVAEMVMITLGTGIGSGVISQSRLVRGVKGQAVEAGHMTIDANGPLCGCGKKGCFEAFCGGRLFVERYNSKSTNPVQPLDVFTIFQRARQGEPLATECVNAWTYSLAVGIGNIVNLFNPEVIVLTGGVSRAFPGVEASFQKILLTQAFHTSLKWVKVVVSQLQEKAGIYGAALWAQQQKV